MPAPPPRLPDALRALATQPRVRDFFARAFSEGRLSHAYLFLGVPGSGKTEAALALAQLLVCPNGGDGTCDECIRVSHRTHPDVHLLAPESASGYLVRQVRDLIDDVSLAPTRSRAKVYILGQAGLLRGAAANALLKTMEEPPAGVYFVLIARCADAVLPTLVSRCQQVPFRIVGPDAAERAVELRSGIRGTDARVALSVAGTPDAAASFLASAQRRQVRSSVVRALAGLAHDDAWDVLLAAREIVEGVRSPLESYRKEQDRRTRESGEYLSPASLRQLEQANKRELTARERSGMMEALAAADSLLRDVLVRREGVSEPIVNEDVTDVVDRLAQTASSEGVLRALGRVLGAADDLAHNVSPQLVLETMLLSVKEALACPPSSR
ncbi:DNA polymerase III subunit [Olsenella massiliensis]|uniref:DNA polymerase III subunit n=1 Tax=Olsenella massiliensis TaxID=1622075 RepID=UPI00071D68BF|nr:DNA polymerase III subunit delta' C-terminal domain-containing protein [Olsenella massiliensis]